MRPDRCGRARRPRRGTAYRRGRKPSSEYVTGILSAGTLRGDWRGPGVCARNSRRHRARVAGHAPPNCRGLEEECLMNWLSQIFATTIFSLRTIPERRGAAITAAVGIAGVVAVFVGVLSIAEGFRAAMTVTGGEDVAIVLRSGADTEMTSGLSREEARLIADAPGLARSSDGPLASAELFVIINLPKRSTGTDANVPLRGIEKAGTRVRSDFKIVEGRTFELGRSEAIVGAGAARAFSGLDVGKTIRVGQSEWTVVGIFAGGGGSAESEIWTDAAVLQPAFHRGDSFQSVYAKLASHQSFNQFKDALTANPQLKVKVQRQS